MARRVIVLVFIGLLVGRIGAAQSLPSDLSLDITAGTERVFVQTSESGDRIGGHLLEIGPGAMALLVDGQRRDIDLDRVLRIDVAGDSVKNGARIGAAILGGWCLVVCSQVLDGGQYLTAVAFNAGFGALIGAGIDGLHQGRTTIYRRRAPSASAPVAGGGVALSYGFRF